MNQINFEGATIGFRNFAGEEGPFNKAGDRNFVVFVTAEEAEDLLQQGWNVKFPKERDFGADEEDTRNPYLPVSVNFKNIPPKVIMITGDQMTKLGEEDIAMLDWAEIEHMDLIVRPYQWSVNGNSGVKAYLKAMYVTLVTDEFAQKYGI